MRIITATVYSDGTESDRVDTLNAIKEIPGLIDAVYEQEHFVLKGGCDSTFHFFTCTFNEVVTKLSTITSLRGFTDVSVTEH